MGNLARSALLVTILGGMLAGCLIDAGASGTPCGVDADCPVYFACSAQSDGDSKTCQPLGLEALPSGTPDAGPRAPVSFATDVQPILAARCGPGCHQGATLSSGVDFSTAQSSFASIVGKPSVCKPEVQMVTGGDTGQSMLWRKLANAQEPCGGPMPYFPGLKEVNPAEFEIIEAWITQGALDN